MLHAQVKQTAQKRTDWKHDETKLNIY